MSLYFVRWERLRHPVGGENVGHDVNKSKWHLAHVGSRVTLCGKDASGEGKTDWQLAEAQLYPLQPVYDGVEATDGIPICRKCARSHKLWEALKGD